MTASSDELGKTFIETTFAGENLVLDGDSVLYFPDHKTLLVSDLHFEKGSYFATKNSMLPAYDTLETLHRLQDVISKYKPKTIICMGDSFHDFGAEQRINLTDTETLNNLCDKCEWIWIIGNHDKFFPGNIRGQQMHDYKIGKINLSHEPTGAEFEIIGHFHPKAKITIERHRITGRAFIYDSNLMIMPSFGSYTGGLYTHSPEIQKLFSKKPKTFMIYNKKIWRII